MDLYFEIKEIKKGQEKILDQLNTLIAENSQPRIYTTEDIEKLLDSSKRTVATWLHKGLLPHTKVLGKIWVTEAQLKEFLEKFSVEPNKNNGRLGYGK